ncbi:thioredoxin family protein [Flavobacterium sp. CYK-4]|uniref:thioredoxin family protein n=1 Tax=Flavobacterium lotistagni TaxID=2709660 RepID=UPI00140CB60D|nr:thioredoxin family protein [Flavobacterium lotistagni]NHM05794.1 thioredoxin family protein [Flavobacterium lotistagni]
MKIAVAQGLVNSHSYSKYRAIVSELFDQGKVSGNIQSEDLLAYTNLNQARMNRLDKKMVIAPEYIQKLLNLKKQYIWLVLSEGWCGDAAQLLPIMNKMAEFSPNLHLKIAFRDENENLMNQFLTNGSRAIPKLIVLDTATEKVLGSWGARPKGAADLIKSYKQQYGVIDETAKKELQLWYLHDQGLSTQRELVDLMLHCEQLNLQTP